MMIIVCPFSFGFSSSWVTDCDTAVAQSEFVTEVGTTRAALRRLLDQLPRSWASRTLGLNTAELSLITLPREGKEKPADRTNLSIGYVEPAVVRWVDVHLRLIQPPRAGHSKGAPSWGAFFCGSSETRNPARLSTERGSLNPQRESGQIRNAAQTKDGSAGLIDRHRQRH